MFVSRTYGEQEYILQLNVVPTEIIVSYIGQRIVKDAELCLCYPLFAREFRYLDRRMSYWIDHFRHERHMHDKHNIDIT